MIHRPLAEALIQALSDVFAEGRPADKVVEYHLRSHSKWGGRDRRFFAENLYEIVRHYRRLLVAAGIDWPAEDQPPALSERDRWSLLHAWCGIRGIDAKTWPGEGVELSSVSARWERPVSRCVRDSLPDWLDGWAQSQIGADWDETSRVLNEQAPAFLRANRLKTDAATLLRRLQDEGIAGELCGDDAIRLSERKNVFRTNAFQQGLFEMQDLHSQKIAPLLRVEPGQRVIDACAGAGGKTLHLASLMGGKGKIIALDVHEGKLQELKKRVRRSGASLIEPRWIEGSKTIKRLKGSADAVLLDVPCTGFGVWRRNPDGKWKLRPERIDELVQLQERILSQYSQMVRDGGVLVYATCSIAPVENRKQIDAFLATAVSQWDIEEELNLLPKSGGGDGFYGIRLRHRQK